MAPRGCKHGDWSLAFVQMHIATQGACLSRMYWQASLGFPCNHLRCVRSWRWVSRPDSRAACTRATAGLGDLLLRHRNLREQGVQCMQQLVNIYCCTGARTSRQGPQARRCRLRVHWHQSCHRLPDCLIRQHGAGGAVASESAL